MHAEGNIAVRSIYWETPPLTIMVLNANVPSVFISKDYVAEIRANMYQHAYQSFVTPHHSQNKKSIYDPNLVFPVSPQNSINCC
jgi:hypothetical protein